jgi:hypothetical protein
MLSSSSDMLHSKENLGLILIRPSFRMPGSWPALSCPGARNLAESRRGLRIEE